MLRSLAPILLLILLSCKSSQKAVNAQPELSGEDLIVEAFVQKEVAGSPEDSSYFYLHLITQDTLPEKVDLRSITFMWQGFTLNPYQTIYKFKLKPPEQGLHQKGELRYVNKSDEVTVIKTKSIIIPIPRKEDLFLP